MVEVADRAAGAAWKIKNLEDYDRRLERAARRVDGFYRENESAAFAIYESVLVKSGRPIEEVREKVRLFIETFEDEEEPFIIPRVSGIMNVEGDEWFFGDVDLRTMTGRLLGQFQHRVAQYNYVDEQEVLKRWADSYDTRLFIRRRIYETEPVAGVVPGFDLPLVQHLRVAAGGDTVVPTPGVSKALVALGFGEPADDYEALALAEGLALHLELPAPIVGEMLEDIAREGLTDFPEPLETTPAGAEEESEGGAEAPSPPDRADRRAAREDASRGEEPSRVQDPQAKDAPGVEQEEDEARPAPPESGRGGAPGSEGRQR
jgi:hypothetical protein